MGVVLADGAKWVEEDVPDETLEKSELFELAEETEVVVECVSGGRGAGIPGPSGGYSNEGAVLLRFRVANGRSIAIEGRDGEVDTRGGSAEISGKLASVGVEKFELDELPHCESGV